jgi:PKD repeat protein
MKFSTPRVLAIAAAAAFLTYGSVSAQQCATKAGTHFDVWPVTGTSTCGAKAVALTTASFGGKMYAFEIEGCSFTAYPVSGATVGSGMGFNAFGNSNGYAHNEYRMRNIALLDDFPYGIVSMSSEGWATFRINYTGNGISSFATGSRLYFGDNNNIDVGQWAYATKLYRAGDGHVYAIGHWLDSTNPALAHFSLGIFDMGTDATANGSLTWKSWIPYQPYLETTSTFDVIYGPSGPVLYIYTAHGVDIFDISNPAAPVYKTTSSDEGLIFTSLQVKGYGPDVPRGTAIATVTEGGGSRIKLYTYPVLNAFYIYDVTDPLNPVRKNKTTITNGADAAVGIASDGKLLAVMTARVDHTAMIRYYGVTGDTPREIPHTIKWSGTVDPADPNYPVDPAYNYEQPADVVIVPPTAALPTAYKVLRAYSERAFWDTVSVSCLDTTPTAGVSVARSASTGTATCAGNPTHGGAVKGFPGDSFTITNTATGLPAPTLQSIVVTGIDATAGNTSYTSGDIKAQLVNNALTWVSPNNLTGEFQVTLTISESATPAVQYIYLCGDPDPALVVSQYMAPGGQFQNCNACGWLSGYTLRLSGTGSEGLPNWATSVWTVELLPKGSQTWGAAPGGDYVSNSPGTLDLTLNSLGTYRVTLDPHYGYTDTASPQTAQQTLPSGAVTATIVVTQNSANVADGGTVLTTQDVNLSWSGQCSGGNGNCTFAWTAPVSCGNSATCTIPANTLSNGQPVNLSLTATHTPSGDTAADTHGFTASTCSQPGAPANSTPASGASVSAGNVTFSWAAASGTPTIQYTVKDPTGATLCGPTPGTSCSASFADSGTVRWFVVASNNCGTNSSTATSFTVGSSCTAPGTPSLSSPANGTTVSPGSVTFSWGAVGGSAPITYTVKNASNGTLCVTSGTSCSANLSSGALSWHVDASNSCNTASSSARSLTVSGGSCATLGTPVQTSPAAGATVPVGNVTLSWSAASGSGVTYIAKTPFGNLCGPTSATSCTTSVVSGDQVSWSVTATDQCGNTSASPSRISFTAGPSCTQPATPVQVSPADGATVSASSVTLSWSQVSGTTPITYTVKDPTGPPMCTTAATSCTIPLTASGQVKWLVQASNSCGALSSGVRSFTVNLCAATSAPVADFTITPAQGSTFTGIGFTQAQPYVGQAVTLTNTSAPGPLTDVSWYDFGVPGGVGTIKTTNVTYAWPAAGNKNVRLTVANCFNGTSYSAEKLKVVTIYADSRPVVADFSPVSGNVGTPVTFTAATGAAYGDPDGFSWKFDDEASPRTGVTTSRTFTCSKQVGLTLTVTGRGKSASTTKSVVISGSPQCCAASAPPVLSSFASTPTDTLNFQGVQQQQPYVGQLVQFDPTGTPSETTAWSWDIATQPTPNSPTINSTDQKPTYTFLAAGSYPVKLTPSNCKGAGGSVTQNITVYADIRPVTADFTCNPASPAVLATTTCTASDGFAYGNPDGFDWTFPGSVKKSGKVVTFTFTCAGANQVSLIAKRGATASPAVSKTVTSTGTPSCCKAPNRAGTPSPATGATIPGGNIVLGWSRPTQGTDPLRYDVYLDGVKLPECTDLTTLQCLTTVLDGTATHLWKVIAKSNCGDTTTYPDTPPEWRFKACSFGTSPDATAFTASPSGPIEVKGVVQQQPYVGQKVTFSYDPTVPATSWLWTDYQKSPAVSYDVPHPEVVYSLSGDRKMYLRASNCAGTRSITQYVKVYEDVRPVEARFTYLPTSPDSLEPVTFSFVTSDEVGNPNEFTIDFGDGTPPETTSSANIQHAYGCAKLYRPTVTARRIKGATTVASEAHSEDVTVSGYPCSAQELMVVDQLTTVQGADGVTERGDMIIFNPSGDTMQLDVAVRDRDTGFVITGLRLPPLPPQGSLALADLMGQLNLNFTSATLWLKPTQEGVTTLPVINAIRYVETPGGAKYGQILPVVPVWPAADQSTSRWITGLVHNGSNAERNHTGFVTKLTFVDPTLKDPNRTPWGSKRLILRLYDNQTGRLLYTDSLNLDDPRFNGYRQDYINNFFHQSATLDMRSVTLQVEIPAGISVVVSSSMFDNFTARAVVFPSQTVQ